MSKVTIVVPTYNVEAYIEKCLNSLVDQTCNDYEILVINDGSKANEQPIIDRFVAKYPIVKSIVKENGGYGSVLNKALEVISSPYMMICDPDDYLYPHTVETLLKLMERNDVDMVIGAKTLVYSDNDEQVYDVSYNTKKFNIDDERVYNQTHEGFSNFFFIDPSPHAKLYKTETIANIKFPTKVSFTDNVLYFLALAKCKKVLFTRQPLAYYLIDRVGNTVTDVKLGVIKAHTIVFTAILDQVATYNNVPEVFYYRIFEGYKFIINDKLAKVKADKAELKTALDELYTVIEKLTPNKKLLLKYYRKYNDYLLFDQIKDHLLFTKTFSKLVYAYIIKKKI